MRYTIRDMRPAESPLLEDFLYEAIFLPEGTAPPPRSILNEEALRVYIREFGSRPGDVCLMAEAGGQAVGAVWARIMDDYGHVDDETPSLAISLYPAYRGRGIGTNLLEHMLTRLRQGGYKQVSLSVQKANPAANLYRRMGFEIFRGTEEEWIMVRRL
ncbi:GNAT family N-acetyltransferase [uncultured Oscillibacter sp.]|uniref:GNAT family N-acetyltransferase n=1 Tax=uncultured Oscillibacter sp. TaxID=876091 RepID=UPI0025DB164B|nr:N-acetyltransferase [uncultured Oscillibacter sp.]